jgi:uncharacterized membrane protein YeiH
MYTLDLIGTFAFAITGALKAKGKDLHLLGAILLGIVTAVGGGTIRDLIINRTPLFYVKDQNYLLLAVVASVLTYLLPTFFKKWYTFFRFIDSVGLATFAIIGVSVTYSHLFLNTGFTVVSFLSSLFLGMITGFGGGVIRDTIVGEVPFSFRKGSNYALSAFCGALSFYVLMFTNTLIAIVVSVLVTLFLREIISPFGVYKKFFALDKKKKHKK